MKTGREEGVRALLRHGYRWYGATKKFYDAASDLLVEVDLLRAALIALQTAAAARRQLDREWDTRGDVPVSIAGEARLERLNADVDDAIAYADKVLGDE